ncbi:hypothetical protein AXX12_08685 [Anaerosporomusa subterranea]|uniref:Motility protein n=1 Tax=Anaerosporomusa subterranea TaxID=1794912 RepID=A0A154BRG8_ANASB|nr:YjfB family protein [Anaerosporomusa subterranea]KYZ76499.1 hypothetical protein AXX12_08685 [Anaerosporomusa subterranea]
MDIAALSIMLSQSNVQQQAGISVMKLAMGAATDQADSLTAMMKATELSIQPYLGSNVDVQV